MYVGHNDASNKFEAEYMSTAMEYSVDAGLTWTTYNEENPQQFPGDLTVLVREKGGQYLDAAPAKEFKFTSKVHVMNLNNSISTSLPTLEYSKNDGEWIPLLVEQTVSFQTGIPFGFVKRLSRLFKQEPLRHLPLNSSILRK